MVYTGHYVSSVLSPKGAMYMYMYIYIYIYMNLSSKVWKVSVV